MLCLGVDEKPHVHLLLRSGVTGNFQLMRRLLPGYDELGISRTEIAKYPGMTQPGVGCAVNRGAQIAQSMNYKLINLFNSQLIRTAMALRALGLNF